MWSLICRSLCIYCASDWSSYTIISFSNRRTESTACHWSQLIPPPPPRARTHGQRHNFSTLKLSVYFLHKEPLQDDLTSSRHLPSNLFSKHRRASRQQATRWRHFSWRCTLLPTVSPPPHPTLTSRSLSLLRGERRGPGTWVRPSWINGPRNWADIWRDRQKGWSVLEEGLGGG